MEYDTRSGSKKLNKNLLFTEKILKQSVWTGTKYQSKKKKKKNFFFTGPLCWKGLVCYEQLHTSFCCSGFLISISFLYEGNTGFYMRAALALNGLIEHPQKSALVAVLFGKSLTSKLKNCEVIVTDFLWKVITSVSIKTPADN